MFKNEKSARMKYLGAAVLLEERQYLPLQRLVIIFSILVVWAFLDWANSTELHEIALTKGRLVPQKGVVPIQHRFGGQIESLLVTQGQKVERNDILFRLRDTSISSNLKRTKLKLASAKASKRYFDQEYYKRKELVHKGLESKLPFLSLKAKKKVLEGEIADLGEVVKNHKDQLSSLEIKAPISGYIHALSITNASVIKEGMTIMELVPIDEPMIAEIEISPADIGHIRAGQEVKVKVDSFDFNRYGAIKGSLNEVSPTTYIAPDGNPYYRGYVSFLENSKVPFGPLLPGMTVLVDIHTGDKSVLEYLLKPIFASAQQALRER